MNPYPSPAPGRALTPYTHRPYRTSRPTAVEEHDPEPSFRVGEVERATACDALAEHFTAGRLDPAELDDRLARAMAARTQSDLQVLFRDLGPRRTVLAPPTDTPSPGPGRSSALLPVVASLLVVAVLLAGGMLLVLGEYNPALFVAALVGGTATAVAGACVAVLAGAYRRL